MRLIDLEPRWYSAGGNGVTRNGQPVPHREGVGVSFRCPCGCGTRLGISFSNPLDGGPEVEGIGNTWARTGNTFETLTLSPSIQRADPGGCRWHGFLRDGVFTNA